MWTKTTEEQASASHDKNKHEAPGSIKTGLILSTHIAACKGPLGVIVNHWVIFQHAGVIFL